MEARTARKGANAGGLFWGCASYPACKGTRDFGEAPGVVRVAPNAASSPAVTGPAPTCPEPGCGAPMHLKTAHRGRNAGNQFWACTRYPSCKGTRSIDMNDDPGAVGASGAFKRLVLWADGTADRRGWICRYTVAGGSTRSFDLPPEVARAISQCWIARTDSEPSASPDAERLVGLLRKILQRGSAPPIDPRAELFLLEKTGLSGQAEASGVPGDLSVRLRRPPTEVQLELAGRWESNDFTLDPEIDWGSDDELEFVASWVSEHLGLNAARWLIPQASLDALVSAHGLPAAGKRRVDFLAVPPGSEPFVIEVDGSQHGGQEEVDDGRDDLLGSIGVDVVRVAIDEIRAGRGLGLDEIAFRWPGREDEGEDAVRMLVWAPVQVHRLVLGMLEAVQAGFLSGDRWVIGVDDPLGVAPDLIAPYLDLMCAADRLWGGDVVPAEIVILSSGVSRRFERGKTGFHLVDSGGDPGAADVLIRLEADRGAMDELLRRGSSPEVVVRSARLPVEVADPVYEGAGRIGVRTEGEEIEWALRVMLQSVFAKEDFREGQLDALFEVIEGRDCAVLLPTGAGKSLIYQLAGLVLPGRTLVIDPLVALMEDQVDGLRANGIDRVAAISSYSTQQGQQDALLEQVRTGYALFVFVAPERLQQRSFREALRTLTHTSLVNLAVVDEAHCVSEWGHDFRTSYLNLGQTIRDVCKDVRGTPPPILALTGTASRAVLRDVLIELEIERDSERSVVRPQSFDRAELRFEIYRAEPGDAAATLRGYLQSLPARFGVPASDFFRPRREKTYSGIVFCPHRSGPFGVLDVRRDLATVVGVEPAIYSGGAPRGLEKNWEEVKRSNAAAFKTNQTPLLVSTKAFGMGIDKSNIRYVVHYGIPGSIEGYYQEVGRAGRDRRNAWCGLVLIEYDEDRARRLLSEEIDLEDAREENDLIARADKDDIAHQLWFHLNSFRGVDEELAAVKTVLDAVGELGKRRSFELPMGERPAGKGDDPRAERERALHRLVVLGVIRDYLVEWGARKFPIELSAIDSAGVVDRLVEYVRRNQPGRADAIGERAAPAAALPLSEAILDCSRLLIEFVYETVERSRRRSLREMWLAARESQHDPNGAFRQRILDYLSQGAIAPTLERLVDRTQFSYREWIDELAQIDGTEDAREMRGDSARLLSSYPDHPGLLLARGLSEVMDGRGNLQEFSSNLGDSLTAARARYGSTEQDLAALADWLLAYCAPRRSGALAVALAVLEKHHVGLMGVRAVQRHALRDAQADPAAQVIALAGLMDEAALELEEIARYYEGVV
jgi:ATP-dependent DNA helicase RecQ